MKLFRICQYLILVVTVETYIIPKCTCCCNNKNKTRSKTEQDQNLDFILKAFKIKKEDIIERRTIQIKNKKADKNKTEENLFKEVNKKSKVEIILSQRKRLKNNPDGRLAKLYYLKSGVNPDTTLLENITDINGLDMWFLTERYDSVNKKFINVGCYIIKTSPGHA